MKRVKLLLSRNERIYFLLLASSDLNWVDRIERSLH